MSAGGSVKLTGYERGAVLVADFFDDICPETGKRHTPAWDTLHMSQDGQEWYVDVNCKHCGRSGCVAAQSKLESEITW